jgi:hypothetical protein
VISSGAPVHVALGGGGLGGLLIHLIIWHEIWRLLRYVWHIHTFGPFIVLLIIAAIIGASVWRRQRGAWRPGRRAGGSYTGAGTRTGPRDW